MNDVTVLRLMIIIQRVLLWRSMCNIKSVRIQVC